MSVQLAALEDFVEPASRLTNEQFMQRYPGFYLLAMGALDVEMLPKNGVHAETSEMVRPFNWLRHGAGDSNLAGRLFVIPRAYNQGQAITLGREAGVAVTIPDTSVSSEHATLTVDSNESVFVRDLNSMNGTSVNNTPIQSDSDTRVRDGDLLTFGRYSFQFFRPTTLHAALRLLR